MIARNQAAVEQHREKYEEGKTIAERKLFSGKRISEQGGDEYAQGGSHQGYDESNAITFGDLHAALKEIGVSVQRELSRPEAVAIFCKRCLTGK